MKLPNADRAIVRREKIVEYLLNSAHPDNGGKGQFFARLGFVPDDWQTLADALKAVAAAYQVTVTMESPHGIKYILDGDIHGPIGVSGKVRTVWIVDRGKSNPRLVTAYPSEGLA